MVGLDYGHRRIGVAVSDPTGTIASPHSVVAAASPPTRPPEKLLELLRGLDPATVVVGIPLSMDGSEGSMALEAREFAAAVGRATGAQIEEWDERLTTARAERALREMSPPSRRRDGRQRRDKREKRDKGKSDMVAASLLLQSYLMSREPR